MKPWLTGTAACTLLAGTWIAAAVTATADETAADGVATAQTVLARLPLWFEPNQGQASPGVEFLARGPGYDLFLSPTEIVVALAPPRHETAADGQPDPDAALFTAAPLSPLSIRLRLLNGNPAPPLTGRNPLTGRTHYFIGNDPSRWRRHVPSYGNVHFDNVYPGVDLVFHGRQSQLEFDFIVAPGADPQRIEFEVEGSDSVRLDAGNLVIVTAGGDLLLRKPEVFQESDHGRVEVPGRFVLGDERRVRFSLGPYDPQRPLVIDPVLSYSTYFGGTDFDLAAGIALDPDNNIVIVGKTRSPNFIPTPLGSGTVGGIFITKLRSDGSAPIFSAYLAGSNPGDDFFAGDEPTGIAVDPQGSILVCGWTSSPSFPVRNALQPTRNQDDRFKAGTDAFVTKLNPAGDDLVYSTYLGGNYSDGARGMVVDTTGVAYVTGFTHSTNFPTSSDALAPTLHGPLSPAPVVDPKPLAGNSDAFIAKLSPSGALLYSTYFGGSYHDLANDVAVDTAGTIHVVGTTGSADLPTTESAYQKDFLAPEDGFFLKLDATGRQVRYLTYFGGNGGLEVRPRVLGFGVRGVSDVTTNGIVTLRNPGSRTLTITFFDESQGSSRIAFPNMPPVPFSLSPGEELPLQVQATVWSGFATSYRFVARVEGAGPKDPRSDVSFVIMGGTPRDSDLAEPIAGSSTRESPNAIALDAAGNAYIAGTFTSYDFPTKGAQRPLVEKQFLGDRAFVAKFDSTSSLQYSVILSGEGSDSATGIVADELGNAYVVGGTTSEQFPVVDPLQSVPGGTAGQFGFPSDAFVTKLSPSGDPILFSTFLGGAESDHATSVALDAHGNILVAGATTSADFPVTNAVQSTFASLPKKDLLGFPFLVPDAFIVMISQTQLTEEIQVWQRMEVPRPGSTSPGLAGLGQAASPANFRVLFSRMVGGVRIEAEAQNLEVIGNVLRFRVPVDLLGPSDVPAPPVGLDPNVTLEIFSVPDGRLLVRVRDLRLRLPQPIIVDELDTRLDPAAIRNVLQFVLGAPSPRIDTFVFLGRSSDGGAGLRVLNTALRFPQPLRFELDDVVVFEPNPATGRFRRIDTPFHIPNLGPGNQGIQFNVSQNGLHVIAVEANTNSPGPFPARYQLHLAANVGLPQRLINGVTEFHRGTRLDTLFNHPAPRTHGLFPGVIGVARTALFKFANVATISQFAQAVLVPPSGGFSPGMRIVRAVDPAMPLGLTTPTARTPESAAPVIGTVLDFTQIPIPESLAQPPPPAGPLSETVGAVLGQNDGNALTLPKTFANDVTVASVILDMGSGHEIVDGPGADLEVLAASGSYTVRLGNTPYADSFSAALGPFTGVELIDLEPSGLRSARYVWIIPAPSLVLDAVRSLNLFADEVSPTLGAITHVKSATITARRAKAASNLLDPFLQLIAPNGDLFGENEAGFGDDLSQDLTDAALVNRELPQDGFYRYLVKGYDKQPDNQSSGTFFTRLETSGNYDPTELAVSSASEEQSVAQKSATISSTRQRDSFLFVAEPGKAIHIVVSGKNAPADFDPVVELYDPEGFLIAASDNGGGSRGRNPALLNVTLPATTQAGSAAPNPGTYRVVVSALDSFGSPSPLPVAGTAHVRQPIGGAYELKVFTGSPSGGVPRPQIDNVNPTSGSPGTPVIISGANFSLAVGANVVRFGNTPAAITSATATQIVTAVPAGLAPGAVSLSVSVGDQTSASADFTVTDGHRPPPTVAGSTVSSLAQVNKPGGIAVDASGNVFVVGRDSGTLSKITPAGAITAVAELGADVGGWYGPALDHAGNLYVSHFNGNEVLKITPGGGISILARNVIQPTGLAVDANGNVYVASLNSGKVFKVTPATTPQAATGQGPVPRLRASGLLTSGTVTEYATGLAQPVSLAFSANGELFVGDRGNNQIWRVPVGGGEASLFAQVSQSPDALAFDRAGNLIVIASSNGTEDSSLVRIDSSGVVSPLGGGFGTTAGLAVDSGGNLYIAEGANSTVFKVSAPPPVSSGARTAQARLYSESIRVRRATAASGGDSYVLELTSLPEDQPPNGELYPIFSPFGGASHSADFILSGSSLSEGFFGTVTLDAPIFDDKNTNEIPDFYETGPAVAATTFGDYVSDFDEGAILATWSRPANSSTGTCRLLLTSDSLGELPEFSTTFEIAEYLGTLRYTPSAGAAQASLDMVQTGSPANGLKGIISLEREPADPLDELSFDEGTLTNSAGQVLIYFPAFLQRSSRILSQYSAPITFEDGDPSTAFEDYFDWTLVITDPNDSDGDRVPDLSDSPTAPPASLRVSVAFDLASRSLVLGVNGPAGATVDWEETSSLANPAWTTQSSVTLATGFVTIRQPLSGGPSRFYRARLR